MQLEEGSIIAIVVAIASAVVSVYICRMTIKNDNKNREIEKKNSRSE